MNIKHEKEANNVGFTVIGKGSKTVYKIYKCLNCGAEKELQVGNVRKGFVRCNTIGCDNNQNKEDKRNNLSSTLKNNIIYRYLSGGNINELCKINNIPNATAYGFIKKFELIKLKDIDCPVKKHFLITAISNGVPFNVSVELYDQQIADLY